MPFGYDEGCFPCSSCVADLMNTTNTIVNELSPIMEEFKETEKSFYAFRRLNFIGSEIDRLKPEIALLDPAEGNRRIRPLEEDVNNLHLNSKSLNVDFKLDLMRNLSKQAEELSVYGSNVVAEMGEVGVKIMEVIKDVNDVSEYLGEGTPNKELLDTSIKTGRQLLASMQDKNFSPAREKVVEERDLARTLVARVKVWSSPVEEFKTNVADANMKLETFEDSLDDLHNHTVTADLMAMEAQQGNFRNTAPKAQGKVARINQLNDESRKKSAAGSNMVTEAEEFITMAKDSFKDIDSDKEKMEQYVDQFSDKSRSFDNERENIFNLEGEASQKGSELTSTANDIRNIAERAKYPAEAALQAASAYENILKNINSANYDAQASIVTANLAQSMSNGVATKVNDALKEIETMFVDAQRAEEAVVNELSPKLASSKLETEIVSERTKTIKQNLGTISKDIEKMEDLSDVIDKTKANATSVQVNAHDTLTSINAVTEDIKYFKIESDKLRNNHSSMNLHLANTKSALMDYEEKPDRVKRDAYQDYDINERLQRLEEKKDYMLATGDRVSDLVSSIRSKIGSAREALAMIENPGVTFRRGSNLELQVPPIVEDLALKTDVSFFANISNSGEDNERDFMFYMGSLEDTYKQVPTTRTDDYMALQVGKDGRVSLIMDTGAGPVELKSNNPVIYNDWVKIDVSRLGYNVNLSVSTEKEIGNIEVDTVSDQLPYLDDKGQPFGSVFNLNSEYSKIFVGGFPTEKKVQGKITSTDMEGQIEGLTIGGKPVGLWNLKDSTDISGASTR